jgi:hypothetical protein
MTGSSSSAFIGGICFSSSLQPVTLLCSQFCLFFGHSRFGHSLKFLFAHLASFKQDLLHYFLLAWICGLEPLVNGKDVTGAGKDVIGAVSSQ